MEMQRTVKTIAILGVDGDNYEVGGVYIGEAHKPTCYILTKSEDRSVCFENLESFPSYDRIRELVH
ncbi:hypothetical protein [Marinobacterium lacunae]|uniref:hypothetical protein n=1 Tax=Marinobacterium lacunae TaxID=1232683 RepID=UPI0005623C16|nr:hypothetical protein [Marinobacterium lacunae]